MPTSDSVTCRVWRPGECEGTPTCPPRCPRFVTRAGTPALIEPEYPSGLELVETEGAVETVIGATDSRFGPLVTFGLGGVFVEHVEDVAFALAPLDCERASELLASIDAASVLEGARGREPVDTDALAETLVRLSALLATAPEIVEIDLNPVLAGPDGVTAVDLHVELG